jgi:hypothetical protein
MNTTTQDIKKDFKYARSLMKYAKTMLDETNITDYSEVSEIGQIANELVASVSTLTQYLEEKREEIRLANQSA